ncbi:MAG: glutamyl-tRNA reductase [Bacteroidetes bacterium]|nr:glutamyl-tRNA reductase [Bacteroidota bacterium]
MLTLQKIDHHEYSLAEREKYLEHFENIGIENSVLLETCNRIEVYYGSGAISPEISSHLFRVVSGLESKLIGENAIQKQVKEAYLIATEKNNLSKSLHLLFQTALNVGKKVRTQTSISKGAISHASAVIRILSNKDLNFSQSVITIIGVNNINHNLIKYLVKKGAKTIFIGNRTYEKAKTLAEKYQCEVFKLDSLKAILPKTDVLISATSAPHLILKSTDFPNNKIMDIFDLAVPRDIDPQIVLMNKVTLLNIEQIEDMVNQNLDKRKQEIIRAEKIIAQEVKNFSNRCLHEA